MTTDEAYIIGASIIAAKVADVNGNGDLNRGQLSNTFKQAYEALKEAHLETRKLG